MIIASTQTHLVQELESLRFCGHARQRVGLVVTKGNCHDGVGAVINAARTLSDVTVVALLPPSSHENSTSNVVTAGEFHDIGFVEQHKANFLYAPQEELCSGEFENSTKIDIPSVSDPEKHLSYYLTTRLKLINLVQPEILICGEKHWDRVQYTRQMLQDLNARTTIQSIPLVRHANGAVVDRAYENLGESDQGRAPVIYTTLQNAAHAIKQGAKNFDKVENTARLALREAGLEAKKLNIVDELTLTAPTSVTTRFRIICEAGLGSTTLHDNLGVAL
ncbi:MAG: pantoate--beta-alanine ligase [Pseudomonadota bacterium]